MMADLLQWAALACSVVVVAGYVCRWFILDKNTKVSVVLFHIALGNTATAAGVNAYMRMADMQDALCILAAASWLVVSFSTWRSGRAPAHSMRRRSDTGISPGHEA